MTKQIKKTETYPILDTLEALLQMQAGILELFKNTEAAQTLEDLPDSLVPTRLLYDITSSYEALFVKLQEDQLIKALSPKTNKLIH